jgi:two-component system, cell cycle response regulator
VADTKQVQTAAPADASSQVILVLRNLLAERYPDLGEHVNTVARLCEVIGKEVGLPAAEQRALSQAAHLHDIGKLSLPESLLGKSHSLDDDEWQLMRLHTVVGEGMLIAAGLGKPVTSLVRSSHEQMDGTGYPDGLAGEEIPLGARIIGVCDAYDAMTSPRPYRPLPMTSDHALLELMRWSGTQFDTAVVDALGRSLLNVGSPAHR